MHQGKELKQPAFKAAVQMLLYKHQVEHQVRNGNHVCPERVFLDGTCEAQEVQKLSRLICAFVRAGRWREEDITAGALASPA